MPSLFYSAPGTRPFAGHRSADSSDYVYLSFTSLATVALGAFVPAQRLGRTLAVLDVPTGQLYIW